MNRQPDRTALLSAVSLAIALTVLVPATAGAQGPDAARPDIGLSREQIREGWIALFDGETTFGWKVDGQVDVKDKALRLTGPATLTGTTTFGDFELAIEAALIKGSESKAALLLNGRTIDLPISTSRSEIRLRVESRGDEHTVRFAGISDADSGQGGVTMYPGASRTPIAIRVPSGMEVALQHVHLRPIHLKSIFNGRDLTGWKPVPGRRSVFSVTENGELNVKDGNGDLQSEGQYKDFILQLDVISHGKHLNSGVFFRALPGEFWQGYEAQIRNQWEGDDRTKPVDYGTGGIYNRQKARRVVSSDFEWFTYTIAADGRHIALWVDGYQTADHVDEQPLAESARKGSYLKAGSISLQGHDPKTNLSFRNIRIAELPEKSGSQ